MNGKERTYIEEVYKDCVDLERRNELTEFGLGQVVLCVILLKKERIRPFKAVISRIRCNYCKRILEMPRERA